MPFQSEKQRRYLWANEPEIARDWTDTYGSGIAKALGGRIPFFLGNRVKPAQKQPLVGQFQDWLGSLYGSQGIAQLQSQYGAGATGKASDARHIAAMSGLSDTLNPNNLMPFRGDTLAFGAGLINEIPGVYRAIKGQAPIGDVWEDIKANWKGTYGTKYGAKPEDIFKQVYAGDSENIPTLPLGAKPMTLGPNYNYGQVEATPEGIMRPGMEMLDPSDANYVPRNTMAANWSELDDAEAQASGMFTQDKRNLLQQGWDYAMNTKPLRGLSTGYNALKGNVVMPALGIMGMVANQFNPLNPQSKNYNPELQGQIDQLKVSGILGGGDPSGPYKITSGPLAGKNLVSGFGTNDYDEMLSKKISWFEKRKAEKKSISDKAYQKTIEEQKRREREKAAAKAQATQTWQQRYANWQSPSGRDHASTAGIGSRESRQGPAGGSVGASRFR